MRLTEILLEGYTEELVDTIQDLLVQFMVSDKKTIPTEEFRHKLASEGFVVSIEELIQAVDQSGFANSVDKDQIVTKDEMSADIDTSPEAMVDIGAMAGDQAMADVNSELPQ